MKLLFGRYLVATTATLILALPMFCHPLVDRSALAHSSRIGPPKATPQTTRPTPRVRIPGQTPNIIDRVRSRVTGTDLGPNGERISDEDSILTDQDRIDAGLDDLIDAIIEALNPIQAAERSVLDEYLEAAARPENKDKTPDQLMEEAVQTVVERVYSEEYGWDKEGGGPTTLQVNLTADSIMNGMRQGESPVLDTRPGGMSQAEWNAHLDRKEQKFQDRYETEMARDPTKRPEIRPMRDSNNDRFVAEARAAANVPFGSEIDKETNPSSTSYTMNDPFGDRSTSIHGTRDTKVTIVNESGRETGVKVEFRPFGAYGGQQPVVYGEDPTVDSKLVDYSSWAVMFNTNNVRTFGHD